MIHGNKVEVTFCYYGIFKSAGNCSRDVIFRNSVVMVPDRSTMTVVASSKASFLGSSPTCHPSSTRSPACATAALHNCFDGLLYPSTKLWTINVICDDTPNPRRMPSSRSSKSEITPIITPARDNRLRHGITSSNNV